MRLIAQGVPLDVREVHLTSSGRLRSWHSADSTQDIELPFPPDSVELWLNGQARMMSCQEAIQVVGVRALSCFWQSCYRLALLAFHTI
jgi:hypothetical protein